MSLRKSGPPERGCSSDCTYRRLYEGSQRSLNEMAALQAAALTRAGRLRAGVITGLKRTFPELFQRAEKDLGQRLSDVDDELLLAYLASFLDSRPTGSSPQALVEDVSSLLADLGGPLVPGRDVAGLLAQLRSLKSAGYRLVREADAPPPHNVKEAVDLGADAEVPDSPAVGGSSEVPPEPAPVPSVRVPLSDLFPAAVADLSAPSPIPLSHVFGESAAAETPLPDRAERQDEVVMEDETGNGDAPAVSPPAGGGSPEDLSQLAVDPPVVWDGELGEPDILATWSPSPVRPTRTISDRVPGSPPAVAPHAPQSPAEPAADTPAGAAPLRPQLFPSSTARPKRGSRRARTQALPPENLDVPVAPQAPAPVGGELSDQLLATACLPRPVFARDLVEVAGSRDAVDAWESQCRAEPAKYPVRFIGAKSRHRLRGTLVLPSESARDPKDSSSPWFRCVDTYRAARVYEMGVLFHRVVDEVVSAEFTDFGATLRLNSSRGLVALVVMFESDLSPGTASRAFLSASVATILGERLSLAAVLTTAGEERALATLVDAASVELASSGAGAPFPVIAARSWEYADDRGTSAVLVQDAPTQP